MLPSFIGNFHLNLSGNFSEKISLRIWPSALGPAAGSGSLGLRVLSGLGFLSQRITLSQVFSKSSSWLKPWAPTFFWLPSFPFPRSPNTVLFFPLKVLVILWRLLSQKAYASLPKERSLWHGLHVFAVDLTSLCLPEALWLKFGAHRGCRGDGPAQCEAAVLYDLHTRIPIATQVGHSKERDRHLLEKLLRHLNTGILLVMDMGFYSIQIFSKILKRGAHFLIPMRANGKPKLLRRFGRSDGLYQIKASNYWKGVPGVLPTMIVRIITVHRKGFRPRRFVTSLVDPIKFPQEEIAILYHERWHLETFFREFKYTMKAQSWHARTSHAFYVELVFLMLLATLTRLAMAEAASRYGIPPGSLSFGKCLGVLKRTLELAAYLPLEQWDLLYQELLKQLVHFTIDVRPNRFFERDRQRYRRRYRNKRKAQLLHLSTGRTLKHAA